MSQGWHAPGDQPDQRQGEQQGRQQGRQQGQGWDGPPPGAPDLSKPAGPGTQHPQQPAPPYGQQHGQQYGYGYGPGTPPPAPLAPRPGVIPLRPLSLGEIYDGAFQAMRRNPGPMIGSAAIVGAIIALVNAVFELLAGPRLAPLLDPAGAASVSEDEAISALGALGVGGLVTVVVTLVGVAVLNGVLVLPVSRAVTGQSTTFGEVWAATWPRFWALLGVVVLAFAIGLGIYLGAFVPVVVLAFVHPAFLVLLLVSFPVVVLGLLWLLVRSSLAVPALMLERTGPMASWRRVRTLVGGLWTGPFWRSLGILVLAGIITAVAQALLIVPAELVSFAIGSANPDDPVAVAGYSPPQVLLSAIASIVASAVVYPFTAGVGTLLYIDHRMRREGLDVELARVASQ